MIKPGVFIYRQPLPADLHQIRHLQELLRAVPSFRPTENPHLTLLSRNVTHALKYTSLERVVNPPPKSTTKPLTLDVDMVAISHLSIMRASYRLLLNDCKNLFHDEHKLFKIRACDALDRVPLLREPHVTIGYSDPLYTTQDVLKIVAGQVPQSLTFGKIESDPDIVKLPEQIDTPDRLIPVDAVVGTVRPGTIPGAFLASLQNYEASS